MAGGSVLHIGFNNVVLKSRIIAVVNAGANPIRRLVEKAKESGKLIDATSGRKTRSVIFTDADFIVLSSLQPQRLIERLEHEK
ncbi:MAG: DUF370 domain-containing protein [Candidatus Omnitrophica bacterium]|nr:DUF370 domain-containing protein [Candidatus Omnitrophota bacterium]